MQNLLDQFGLFQFALTTNPLTGASEIDNYNPRTWALRAIVLSGALICMLPISLLRELNSMRYMTLVNLCVLTYIISLVLFQSPAYISYFSKKDYQVDYWITAPTMNWFSGFATIIMSFSCQPNFFYIRSEMIDPSKQRVKKVIKTALVIETVLYLLISVAGYLSLGKANMVSLYALRPKIGGKMG